MERKIFIKGDVIIEKGSHDTCAYIVESGKVEVSNLVNNKKIVFGVLVKGQIFGEMGLVED
jgi:CRP-like cAMP-binding protein